MKVVMEDEKSMPLMMSAKHIQELGFSRTMAYELMNKKDAPVVQIGRRKFVHRDKFLEYLEKQVS